IIENRHHDISSLIYSFEDIKFQELLSGLIFSSDDLGDEQQSEKILKTCINKLKLKNVDSRLKFIRNKLRQNSSPNNKDFEKKLLKEYRDLVDIEKTIKQNIYDA
ncbi:MAG: hypothetical protein ACRENO_08530, partial [Thermodesulfobacteriota bacterium]